MVSLRGAVWHAFLWGFLAALHSNDLLAQDTYPSRPITLTHGFAAGGNADVITRIIADGLSPRLGQPVVVEPRPGAGGNIASARLAKSPPDGYTLVMLTGGHAVSAAIYKKLQFDSVEDFEMISTLGYQAFIVGVRSDNAIKSLSDLISTAKASPGKLTFASVGVGSTQHLAGELFCSMAGVQMTHVPYRSGAGTIADLLGGQIDVVFNSITVVEPQVRAGAVRALGVTSISKWWSLPDIVPVSTTVPNYDVQTWVGVAAPKGTPQPVVKRLNDAMRDLANDPAVQERLKKIGMDVRASSSAEMRSMIADQISRWKRIVSEAKIPQQD